MEQRRVATTYTFLVDPQSNLRDMNAGDQTPFMAMVFVPGTTHKIKILYGLDYGTSGIASQVSPIVGEHLLALFGEGSTIMGPAQVISLNPAI